MKYSNVIEGIFLKRPNRFIANVLINSEEKTVHVKNTGRCRELLQEGCKVFLHGPHSGERKTEYDLIAVEKEGAIVNMDSQVVNTVASQWLKTCGSFSENAVIRREVTYGKSRFDIFVEDGKRRAFVEVKGVTLENGGVAMFPDAPTQRGAKHMRELVSCMAQGYEAYVIFVVQMEGVHTFRPNTATDGDFARALKSAKEEGVKIIAVNCNVTADTIEIKREIEAEI